MKRWKEGYFLKENAVVGRGETEKDDRMRGGGASCRLIQPITTKGERNSSLSQPRRLNLESKVLAVSSQTEMIE